MIKAQLLTVAKQLSFDTHTHKQNQIHSCYPAGTTLTDTRILPLDQDSNTFLHCRTIDSFSCVSFG